MREKGRDKGRLEDILEHSRNVEKLIEGFSYDDFKVDIRTYYAVMKNVEIVGEAVYMLTKDFKEAHSEVPWAVIQGMRHVLVHGYASVNPRTLFDTALNGIPEFRQQIELFLSDIDWDAWGCQAAPASSDL